MLTSNIYYLGTFHINLKIAPKYIDLNEKRIYQDN